jgi:protoheme IX farnesyltransferase
MKRTVNRPIPSGKVTPRTALVVGIVLAALGIGWALTLSPLYATVVFAGLFFDVVVYTVWLKRRTAWSIVWGGISGGMPILAGRVLGTGQLDWVGIMLALAVLLWIPTHIMTFNIRRFEDYQQAGIPTFPNTYGIRTTQAVIAISSLAAALAIGIAAVGIGVTWGYLRVLIVLSTGLLALAISNLMRPSERGNFRLFKFASLYMLSAMTLLAL